MLEHQVEERREAGGKPATAADWLVGGGEMGALIRTFDWGRTPLGPVECWPQSLRSAVSICLPSKAQIILCWGPELITLYNDGYRPVFGAKHPHVLGLRMLDHVRDRLLGHPVGDELNLLRAVPEVTLGLEAGGDAAATVHLLDQRRQRGLQAEVVERRRAQAPRQVEELLHRPRGQRAGLAGEIGRASCRERVL